MTSLDLQNPLIRYLLRAPLIRYLLFNLIINISDKESYKAKFLDESKKLKRT
jgi:hypothetical protein